MAALDGLLVSAASYFSFYATQSMSCPAEFAVLIWHDSCNTPSVTGIRFPTNLTEKITPMLKKHDGKERVCTLTEGKTAKGPK
jgi:hypothetical protein